MSHFVKTLSVLEKGTLLNKLDDSLSDLVKKCRTHLQKGELTVTVKIVPAASEETMGVLADVKVKSPAPSARSHIFFTTEDGMLSRTDPSQPEFNLTVTEGGEFQQDEQPLKKVNANV